MGLTEQRADHLEVTIKHIVYHADDDPSEGLLRLGEGSGSEEVEGCFGRAGIVHALGRRLAEDVVRDRHFLEGASGFGIVGKFTGLKTCKGRRSALRVMYVLWMT